MLQALLTGQDVLAVLPTGAGKSPVFQIASQVLPGLTLVVSPLLALMHDQEESLEGLGIEVAVINSTISQSQAGEETARVARGEARLLYVTPERLLDEEFMREMGALPVSLLAVDEAHCVIEWGHSFRPAYQALGPASRRLGGPILLALTATATPWVRRDIVEQLGMRNPEVIVRGSDRPNLFLEVRRAETEADEIRELRRLLVPTSDAGDGGGSAPDGNSLDVFAWSGIVYTATMRAARETAELLQASGISADFYHGQRTKRDRVRGGLAGLARSAQDAQTALSLGRRLELPGRVYCLDDLGAAALVGISDQRTKLELAVRLLGPLDPEPDLLLTLRTFFDQNCCPSATASALAIRRNTLSYRLDKVASLTGLDPRQFDDAIQTRLALLLRAVSDEARPSTAGR